LSIGIMTRSTGDGDAGSSDSVGGPSGVRPGIVANAEPAAATAASVEQPRGVYVISTPIFCRRFIGRQRELRFLIDQRRELAKAHGSVVFVAGEAGIGKSRLIREFVGSTQTARGRVAIAQCRPFGSRPYGPILELLETFSPESTRIVPADSQHNQHVALVDAFVRAAGKHALIGVVEDFHWADLGTAAVLTLLSEAVANRRILVVVTYRSDELHTDHPLYIPLGLLLRNQTVRQLELAALSTRETAELIDAALDGQAANITRQTRRDIARVGEGNPFFTEELLKGTVDRDFAGRLGGSLPTTVRAAILQRIEPLDARDRKILTQAAVIGRRFDGDLLAHTLDATFESLLPTLQRARRCQLVEETDAPRAFRFRHALTREAVYDDLLAAQRRPLHERIALALEATGDEKAIDDLAYHWWASGDRGKALHYGERAGDIALALYEHAGAIAAYERTLALLDPAGRDAARVNEKIGTSYYRFGLMDRAVEHYAPAWEYFRATRDDTANLFRLTRNMSGALYNDGRAPEALAFWSDALAVIDLCGDARIADLARISYAAYLIDDGRVDATLDILRSVDEHRLADDPELAVPYWGATCVASALQGDIGRLRAAVERLCTTPKDRTLLGPFNDAAGEAGTAALLVGDTASARRCFSDALDACITMKSTAMLLADTLLSNAIERCFSGAYEESQSMYSRSLALIGETKVSVYRACLVALWIGWATGDAAVAEGAADLATIDRAIETGKAQIFGPLAAIYARVLVDRGECDVARGLLRRAVAAAGAATLSFGSFPLVVIAAQSCDASDADAVRALARRDAFRGTAPAAAAELADAILARRFGVPDEAIAAARRAAAGFTTVEWPYFEALAREIAGDQAAARALRDRIGHIEAEPSGQDGDDRIRSLLSGRALEIAHLVAGGRSNREVADALFVSVKLVEKHLSSIYRKLGVRSRGQLAARLHANAHRAT
jgi:DNA-binding NarL/FixJ family response regulator